MASSYLEVGSEGLKNLKDDLTKLAQSLHEVFELMNADMRQVGEAWRDGKYEEFVSGYRPQINKCEEISERYIEWCKRVLEPAIEECEDIETTDVGGDGSGSASTGGGGGSDHGVVDNTAPVKNNRGFNMGYEKKIESFKKASEKVKEMANKKPKPVPPGSGFDTPQNEREYTPIEINALLNGRSR